MLVASQGFYPDLKNNKSWVNSVSHDHFLLEIICLMVKVSSWFIFTRRLKLHTALTCVCLETKVYADINRLSSTFFYDRGEEDSSAVWWKEPFTPTHSGLGQGVRLSIRYLDEVFIQAYITSEDRVSWNIHLLWLEWKEGRAEMERERAIQNSSISNSLGVSKSLCL